MCDIKPELIEKATQEINVEKHRYQVDHSTWVPYCTCGWSSETADDIDAYDRHLATLALEAVADDLRAEAAVQALREAADDWQVSGWAADVPPAGADRPALILGMAQRATNFLRSRADRIEARDE